ncbi:hypothetical protein [Streptomyces sp. NBC_01171]|uniref:hypothetical protein n=1 Tax=Streptomyces sp. NBC_01171 TaxID=2903757 RepID=UPI00386FD127|nr:hypothetical protein OG448_30075 [Streptomyces sp. NBC_01171]
MASVWLFVQLLLGEGGADVGGDVEAVDQVELAGRRGGAGADDPLVDDPHEVAALGIGHDVITAMGGVDSARTTTTLTELRGHLADYRHVPAVADFLDCAA